MSDLPVPPNPTHVTAMRPAGKPGDELFKVATAQAVIFKVEAGGFKFACPHCGHNCSVSMLVDEQKQVVQEKAKRNAVVEAEHPLFVGKGTRAAVRRGDGLAFGHGS